MSKRSWPISKASLGKPRTISRRSLALSLVRSFWFAMITSRRIVFLLVPSTTNTSLFRHLYSFPFNFSVLNKQEILSISIVITSKLNLELSKQLCFKERGYEVSKVHRFLSSPILPNYSYYGANTFYFRTRWGVLNAQRDRGKHVSDNQGNPFRVFRTPRSRIFHCPTPVFAFPWRVSRQLFQLSRNPHRAK